MVLVALESKKSKRESWMQKMNRTLVWPIKEKDHDKFNQQGETIYSQLLIDVK